jgi:small GTP-binding protein
VNGRYCDGYAPTIEDEHSEALVAVGDKVCRLDIVDTAGQDPYPLDPEGLDKKSGDAFFLVYDTGSTYSFQSIPLLFDPKKHPKGVVLMLIGNKIDKENRQVQQQEELDLAEKLGASFLEISARTGRGIDEMLLNLAFLLLERQHDRSDDTTAVKPDVARKSFFKRTLGRMSCFGRV